MSSTTYVYCKGLLISATTYMYMYVFMKKYEKQYFSIKKNLLIWNNGLMTKRYFKKRKKTSRILSLLSLTSLLTLTILSKVLRVTDWAKSVDPDQKNKHRSQMLNWDERQFKVTQCLQHSLTFLLICKFKGDQIKKKKNMITLFSKNNVN